MRDAPFDRSVQVAVGDRGMSRHVTSIRQAVECLLYEWPGRGAPRHRAARQACLNALEGSGTVRAAREAFEAAATESDILLGPDFVKKAVASQRRQRDAMLELKDILAAERARREGR